MTSKKEFLILTGAGLNRVELATEDGIVTSVRSNMGKPRFERSEIPMIGPPGRVIEEKLTIPGYAFAVTCVNIGNPHAVIFVDDATTAPLAEAGPQLENHPSFPQRTNVEFVTLEDRDNIVMRIWERGSGVTMASGSGSCAAALAAMITDRTNRRVNVHLVYGRLTVEWASDGFVYQEGPATEVYVGQWPGA
ncbi:MAG: diaminopimelate epimerase, partial [Candidatus Hydrogenedentes bacterium]|nr:diaminopimelate epimerase [Candidatus Hydrogenedentota bacterium]